MNYKFLKTLVIVSFLFAFNLNLFAQDNDDNTNTVNTVTTAVPFLMITPDARAGAMGDAGVSSTPDVFSMHWNPAKYAFVDGKIGAAVSYTPWLRNLVNDIGLSYLSGFYKIDELQTIAASLMYFSLGEIQFTDENAVPTGIYKPNELAVDFAYSRLLSDNFSGAVAVRYIYSDLTQGQYVGGGTIETRPGRAIAADVAAYYKKEIEMKTPALFSFGVNISNIGNKISYTDDINSNFIPINLRLGPSMLFDLDEYNQFAVMLDLNKLLVPTPNPDRREEIEEMGVVSGMFNSFSTAPGGFSEHLTEITYSAGLEYIYDKQFAIRAGYFNEHQYKGNRKYFTVGLGLKYSVLGLDFSYLVPVGTLSPLQNTMRISLSFDFNAWGAAQQI
ncbi:MAG: type IX secretion system outer membrane channel protein PorV [Bacteroidota bacterium]